MAEIYNSGPKSSAAAAAVLGELSSRAARRRRIDIRRHRLLADSNVMAPLTEHGSNTKRSRYDCDIKEVTKLSSNEEISDKCLGYGVTSVIGKRRDMEDAVSVQTDFLKSQHYFGVFDGHGCSHVAFSCKERMHEILEEEIGASSTPSSLDEWKVVMERSFGKMDAEVAGLSPRTPSCRTPKCDLVGSTAVVAVVGSDSIVVANAGDSRAVLCRNGAAVPLSVDHKPDRPDELRRIEEAGGRVIYWDGARVLGEYGVLAMSRAIGDGYLKPFVTAEPEVTVTKREEGDECLILASDGLWDVVTNEMACYIVRMCLRRSHGDDLTASNKSCVDASVLLTKLAMARGSTDNVSVVIVDVRNNL